MFIESPLKIKQGQEQEQEEANDKCADNVITFGSQLDPREGREAVVALSHERLVCNLGGRATLRSWRCTGRAVHLRLERF